MQSIAVVLTKPGSLTLRDLPVRAPGAEDVVVKVEHSGISTGTERLLYTGRMPWFPGLDYPLVPGYESIGQVTHAGRKTNLREGDRVFVPGANCFEQAASLFGGAASHLVSDAKRVVRVNESVGETGILYSLAATAHHALDEPGRPLPDLIVGHGVLGRLIARLIIAKGGKAPVVWEKIEARREGAVGYSVVSPDSDSQSSYQHICDASGDPDALDPLISCLQRDGLITLAGFYDQRLSFDFAPAFMRQARIRIAAEWTPSDLAAVSKLVESNELSLASLITHNEPIANATHAYEQAFSDPNCLKMVLDWRAHSEQGTD
jgi:3-hydroxyethyl bacteriochlorophyllide a dehydrogenase